MGDVNVIQMPLWQLFAMVVAPFGLLAVVVTLLRRRIRRRSAEKGDPDWSVPQLEGAAGHSLIHRWDVRCKIVTIIVYSFMITAIRQMTPALVAIGLSCLVLIVARVSMTKVLMRILAIAGFITMFLLVMPFTVPLHKGDTVIVFGGLNWLQFSMRGFNLAATIAAKAVAITLLMEPLLATAPLPVTLQGLSRLGVPDMAGQMVLLSYRYINVFRHEARRMATGMQVRGFRKRTGVATVQALANFLGMLFVRSFERTERVFDAMRARGYRGLFPEQTLKRQRPADLVGAGLWLTVGVALLVFDRMIV
ncbi:MAG: cobalt ECF transporter T component CbiQ [Desulfosarcina sp.]|nr:cobalt ECF transporter T component CbiQ [Desulfosarcina sp.]